jgi:glycosyltransferase involved in cell wall biosynthesis
VRILHILTSPRAEGTPRLVLDWLAAPGHEQGVLFLSGEPMDLLDDFRRAGCWLRVDQALVAGPRKFYAIVRAVRRGVREFRPDLLIAWPTGFSHWIFLGARAAGSRAALVSHAGNPPGAGWFDRYLMTWLCLWTTALCRGRLVACSRYVQRLFREIPLVPASRVGFAYNALQAAGIARRAEAARASRPAGDRFRALMVATLEAHKDHATLVRAARLLQDRGVTMEIWLVGAGSLEADLKALVAELGVGAIVKFLGARRDVPELLGRCDVFVLSTTPQEGFGIALFEALAAGLPVIASAVEPVCEMLENGRWGALVRVGDAEALADTLAAAGDLAGETVGARQAYAAGFSPGRMINDYLQEARG